MKTQYDRCKEWAKAHLGKMKTRDFSIFWQGWGAALSWHGHCKDCRFLTEDHRKCTAFKHEPCHLFEPKEPEEALEKAGVKA